MSCLTSRPLIIHRRALTLDELAHWVAFSRFPGVGPVRFKRLLDCFDNDVAAAWKADSKRLADAGLDHKTIEKLIAHRNTVTPQHELEILEKKHIQVITWKDANYPPLLRKIEYAPPVLYVYGTFTEDDRHFTLGIVGTRKMSTYGRQVTERFSTELAQGKITIVSGLALGVDTIAHTAALTAAQLQYQLRVNDKRFCYRFSSSRAFSSAGSITFV